MLKPFCFPILRTNNIQLGLRAFGIINLVESSASRRPSWIRGFNKVTAEIRNSFSTSLAIGQIQSHSRTPQKNGMCLRVVVDLESISPAVESEAGDSSVAHEGLIEVEEDVGWLASAGYLMYENVSNEIKW